MISFSAFENQTDQTPYNISGSIWAPYEQEMRAMQISFPEYKDHGIFTFRVELSPDNFKHLFFLQHRNEITLINGNLTFPSPRELLDYLKSSECSRERILARMEMEQELSEESSVNEDQ